MSNLYFLVMIVFEKLLDNTIQLLQSMCLCLKTLNDGSSKLIILIWFIIHLNIKTRHI